MRKALFVSSAVASTVGLGGASIAYAVDVNQGLSV
jgi:hypothetical protein